LLKNSDAFLLRSFFCLYSILFCMTILHKNLPMQKPPVWKPFLTANWLNLAMANYAVPPSLLRPYIPPKTALDFFNEVCYMSLVAFRFWNTRIRGFAVPLHTNFEEINLRFYVRHKEDG